MSRPNSHSVTTTRPDKISGRKSIKRIPLSVLEKIRANPELKVIAIGRSWFSKAFIEPSLWGTDNDASGVLFRTYAKCRLRLTHTRLLSQHRRVLVKLLDGIKYELPNGIVWRQWRDEEGYRWEERFHRQQGLAWEDAVDFEGERVPEDVMEHSFEAAGMSWLWQEPGRNLTLPEAVWTELEKWLSERKSFRDAQGGAGGVCDEDEEDDEGEDYNLNNIKQHEMEQEEADWQAYKESRGKIEWDEDESEE